jgi:hypothetical protein
MHATNELNPYSNKRGDGRKREKEKERWREREVGRKREEPERMHFEGGNFLLAKEFPLCAAKTVSI